MIFSSLTFLFAYLPLTLAVYFLMPLKWRNLVLLLVSLFFYGWGEPVYIAIMFLSILIDYTHGILVEKHRANDRKARYFVAQSVVFNLLLLGFFKYWDFLADNLFLLTGFALPASLNLFGLTIPLRDIPLPIGISFFTFQTMSYTIDVYRGDAKAEKNLATFATFVCLFPQLIAGPVVRYTDISTELHERSVCMDDLYIGVKRFVRGLARKVLIANAMGEFCSLYREAAEPSVVFAWLYAIAYALQIYYDFAGYSDMAIGLGRMFGFKFPENFDSPYRSKSITEFWRRWHMTLGGWFRDYLYIPLGGNRVPKARWLLNIAVVWAATGIWHGAAWNFVLWGLYFGALLVLEKLFLGNWLKKLGAVVQHIYVIFTVLVSFVIFNARSLPQIGQDLGRMFGAEGIPLWSSETGTRLSGYFLLFFAAVLFVTPLAEKLIAVMRRKALGRGIIAVLEPVLIAAAVITVTGFLVDGSFNPFLYFRF